jgi:hypothetical protein
MLRWLPSLAAAGGGGGSRGAADGNTPLVRPAWPPLLTDRQSVKSAHILAALSYVQA